MWDQAILDDRLDPARVGSLAKESLRLFGDRGDHVLVLLVAVHLHRLPERRVRVRAEHLDQQLVVATSPLHCAVQLEHGHRRLVVQHPRD